MQKSWLNRSMKSMEFATDVSSMAWPYVGDS